MKKSSLKDKKFLLEATNTPESDYIRLSSNKTIYFDKDYVPIRLGIKMEKK